MCHQRHNDGGKYLKVLENNLMPKGIIKKKKASAPLPPVIESNLWLIPFDRTCVIEDIAFSWSAGDTEHIVCRWE